MQRILCPVKVLDKVLNESKNVAMFRGNRLEGKFVSKNVINLSRRNLSSAEISLLSKGLKFVPTANKIDQAKLKRELRFLLKDLKISLKMKEMQCIA